MYKKSALLLFALIGLLSLSSCGVTTNYLSQGTNSQTKINERVQIIKAKSSLKKPIISYDNKIKAVATIDSIDRNNILERIEKNNIKSYSDLAINQVIHEAESYLGTPYRFGGTTRQGIDCSAFMQKIYEKEGIDLPRISREQASIGYPVSREHLQKGDLIFFSTTSRNRVTHVGMVYDVSDNGEVSFIHASSSRGVTISNLDSNYWSKRYRKARRLEEFASPQLVQNSEHRKTDI